MLAAGDLVNVILGICVFFVFKVVVDTADL